MAVATAVRVDAVWSVAVLSFLVALLSAAGIACGSLMYVLIMDEFGASREAASWPGSVISIVAHISGNNDIT
ncbi:hypothetical protein HPB48_016575 [Haemaphysalis longicornis]|uniref:Uncharacterized protein n=1 Tax=Haemaphysalis longicornis TaxID=44386 RepID=A0A9J6FPM4_HAELO|nr:hypothetical protein HPB48_016575 [Haemaphysalis longicornis]